MDTQKYDSEDVPMRLKSGPVRRGNICGLTKKLGVAEGKNRHKQ